MRKGIKIMKRQSGDFYYHDYRGNYGEISRSGGRVSETGGSRGPYAGSRRQIDFREQRAREEARRRNMKKRRRARRRRLLIFISAAVLIVCFLWNAAEYLKPKSDSDEGNWYSSNVVTSDQESQLQSLLPEYPELKEVIRHRSEYPTEVIDVFLKNQEAVEYLVDYPAEAGKVHRDDIREELKEGGIPLFLQWDRRWGYKKYGSGLIGWTGCGPTCLAMASAGLTGSSEWTPASVAEFSEKEGYYTPGAGTSWDLMTSGAAQLGLHSEETPLSESSMKAQLNSGCVLICSVGPGDFTTEGHYILIRGYDDSGFLVNDPNSRARSERSWPYDRIASQIKNLWAVGKA